MNQKFYRIAEVAMLLSIAESTVWLYIKQQKLHSVKLSPRVTVIDLDELNRFIDQSKESA